MLSTEKVKKIHSKGQTIGQWRKRRNAVTKTISVFLVIAIAFGGGGAIFKNSNTTAVPAAGEESTTSISKPTAGNAISVFIPAAAAAGWTAPQLLIDGQVNPSLDLSKPGLRPFYGQGFKNPVEAIAWLKAGSIEAKGTIVLITAYTGCVEEDMFKTENWVTAQPTVSFSYREMTLFKEGQIKTQAGFAGDKGDIFVVFVAPKSGKMAVVRAGCANPTLFIPEPDEPGTTKPGTTAPGTTKPGTTAPGTTKPGTTTPGTTKPSTTTKPATTKGKDKDPAKDVLNNPNVADWKKNGGELIAKVWESAATASNGYQADPVKEAAEKAAAIAAANKFLEEQHSNAVTSVTVVDSNQEHGEIVTAAPTTNSSGATVPWSPFG